MIDPTRITVGSLFAGIGGFDLAARSLGWDTIWYSETNPYCAAVMARHFPEAVNLGDATRVDWATVPVPTILCGGWPCQPHSYAGRQRGGADTRDLWPEFVRAIRILRPRYVVGENVPGVLTSDRGDYFNGVLSDLASLWYDVEWDVLSACAVGAPHARERLFCVAYPSQFGPSLPGRPTYPLASAAAGGGETPDAVGLLRWTGGPPVSGVAYGVPRRMDRLAALGNAVVPQAARAIFQRLTR